MPKVSLFSREELKLLLKPFEIKTIRIGESRYCLGMSAQQYYLFSEECPHMGYCLENGKINPYEEITCPWHNYRFSLKTGIEDQLRCKKLRVFELHFEGDQLYAELP